VVADVQRAAARRVARDLEVAVLERGALVDAARAGPTAVHVRELRLPLVEQVLVEERDVVLRMVRHREIDEPAMSTICQSV
jgi:hypothetical protein